MVSTADKPRAVATTRALHELRRLTVAFSFALSRNDSVQRAITQINSDVADERAAEKALNPARTKWYPQKRSPLRHHVLICVHPWLTAAANIPKGDVMYFVEAIDQAGTARCARISTANRRMFPSIFNGELADLNAAKNVSFSGSAGTAVAPVFLKHVFYFSGLVCTAFPLIQVSL